MLERLTITELDAYLRLCEHNMEYLATKRRINHENRQINDDYSYTMSLRNRIYAEINRRLKKLSDEHTEETLPQD